MWMTCYIHLVFMSISANCRTSFLVEQQRTAIGRAIVKNPDILLCDEPTGALDYNTSKDILRLIETVNQKYGNTIVIVTHNDAIKDIETELSI